MSVTHDDPPHSIEAEQALLGAILMGSDAYWRLDALRPEHFFEPLHGKIFDTIGAAMKAGLAVDPVLIGEEFRGFKAFKEMGGVRYLLDLFDHSPPADTAHHYARTLIELWHRRQLMFIGSELSKAAFAAENAAGGSSALIADVEKQLLELQMTDRSIELTGAAQATDDLIQWVDGKEAPTGVLSGLRPLDNVLGHMLPGHMILVGGRPSMGKSALASCIALRVAEPEFWAESGHGYRDFATGDFLSQVPAGAGVIEVSEMDVGQMTRRHVADIGFHMFGKDFPTYRALRDKKVSEAQRNMLRDASAVFARMSIVMLRRTGLKVSQMRSLARRQAIAWDRKGVRMGLLIADHVGLFKPEGRSGGRYEDQMEIAIDSKELAESLGCPLLALVQLSRAVEQRDDKRPQLSDLRDAGGWEENADAVLFPYRDAYYANREPDEKDLLKADAQDKRRKSKVIDVIMGKLREGDVSKPVQLWGHLPHNAIRAVAPEFGDLM